MPRNLRQASQAAINRARVNQLDGLGSNVSDFNLEDKLDVVELIAGEFIERVQNNIEKQGLNVSGRISDLSIQRNGDTVEITAYPWLIYLDRGVSGTVTKYNTPFSYRNKMPPVQAFKDWIEARQINTVNNQPYTRTKSNPAGRPQDFHNTDADSGCLGNGSQQKEAWTEAKEHLYKGNPKVS